MVVVQVTVREKVISLPRLDRLSPTLESTALKLMEEAGELAQAIGKLRGLSGETCTEDTRQVMQKVTRELLDVAQTAVSMMFVLEEHYGINIETSLEEHRRKLREKGYLSW